MKLLVKDLITMLKKYPEDIQVVIGVEPNNEVGLYSDVQVGGLDTGTQKVFYIASKDLSEDIGLWKSGECDW